MAYPRVELGEVRMSFTNGENNAPRAQYIAQLTFAYVQQLLERELQHLSAEVAIDRLDVPAVPVSFEIMDDETIARASAEGIYRAVLQVL